MDQERPGWHRARSAGDNRNSGGVIKLGVLIDEMGVLSLLSGEGPVEAASMAMEDFNGKAAGKPLEIVPNQQNKSDIGAAIARRWFDNRPRFVASCSARRPHNGRPRRGARRRPAPAVDNVVLLGSHKESRRWSKRFFARRRVTPTQARAGVHPAGRIILKAVDVLDASYVTGLVHFGVSFRFQDPNDATSVSDNRTLLPGTRCPSGEGVPSRPIASDRTPSKAVAGNLPQNRHTSIMTSRGSRNIHWI